ncbi:MAG: ABC transporter ATP-binding protein, partial [Eggerthellaceae bacterium]|nr:ABC transporter ATP-binding protein [Eggerthellaceae bacterium]
MGRRETEDRYDPHASRRRYANLQAEYANDIWGTTKRIFSYLLNEKALVAAVICVIVVGTAATVCAPIAQSDAIDIIAGESDGIFAKALIAMLAAYLIGCICTLLQGFICAHLGTRIIRLIRAELFCKVIDLSVPYHDNHPRGDTMSRMTNDVDNISSAISQALPTLISGVLTITGTALAMLALCWQLALLSYITVALTIISTKLISKQVRKHSRARQASMGKVGSLVEEAMTGFRTIVSCNRQARMTEDFFKSSDQLTDSSIKTLAFSGIMGPISSSVANIGYAIVATAGGIFALNGIVTVGVISAFIVYLRQFSRPINEVAQLYCQLQTAIAGAERVFAVTDEAPESNEGVEHPRFENPTIRFEDVTFSYVEGKPVLKDFSLDIRPGKKIALVGATGSGKTTVASLILRFYDVDSGRILIDGCDIRDISRSSLRKRIAAVLQDTSLFTASMRENLLSANENATEEQLNEAIQASLLDEVIDRLPQGLDTQLSPNRNAMLSHGQQQLIAIA